MLNRDLAELYKVETKVLHQAVKRNIKRFFSEFMFFTISAAIGGILFIRYRLYQKNGQRLESIVNVICCHLVLGRLLNLVLIQLSVNFLPHEEQNLDLQEQGTRFL